MSGSRRGGAAVWSIALAASALAVSPLRLLAEYLSTTAPVIVSANLTLSTRLGPLKTLFGGRDRATHSLLAHADMVAMPWLRMWVYGFAALGPLAYVYRETIEGIVEERQVHEVGGPCS